MDGNTSTPRVIRVWPYFGKRRMSRVRHVTLCSSTTVTLEGACAHLQVARPDGLLVLVHRGMQFEKMTEPAFVGIQEINALHRLTRFYDMYAAVEFGGLD